MTSIDERNRVLQLVESGQLSAVQAGQLLDTLESEHGQIVDQVRNRLVRVRVTHLPSKRQKVNVTLPIGLINVGLRLGTRLAPQISGSALEDLLHTIEKGVPGRLLDFQDLEEGERVEIFIEQ